MKSIFIVSLAAIFAVATSDCDGYWNTFGGECKWYCYDDDSYNDPSTLSFDFIRSKCDNVNNAYQMGVCNSVDDLVYEENDCECPYCKCSSTGSELVEIFTLQPSKSCYNCTCQAAADSWGITDNIYYCGALISVDEPSNWDLYKCPPNECTEATYYGDEDTHVSGESWWHDVGDSDTLCTEFCYCTGDGESVCATGFDNIAANEELSAKLIESCTWDGTAACYNMDTGSFDADRLYTTDSGPTCYGGCPRCECPTGINIGDTFYNLYQDSDDIASGTETCLECTCRESSDGNYASCNSRSSYPIGYETCGDDTSNAGSSWTCHQQGYSTTGTKDAAGVNATTCYNDGGLLASDVQYCQWKFDNDDEGYWEGAQRYSWGCGTSIICEAYANGKCIYADATATTTDCWGNTDTQTFSTYIKCCDASGDGSNCNYEDASKSECTRSTHLENLFKENIACVSEVENKYECDDTVDSIDCDDLLAIYAASAECQCNLYGGVYGLVGDSSKQALQSELDANLISFNRWNDVLGCDIDISCDLSSGGVVTNNGDVVTNNSVDGKVYFMALLWAVIVYITL